ncbi:hypothetical protein MNBD_ALPHA12-1409 [hydrothermal vent metagenome]|uniref:TadE-like domain-containing protein n=1 Tax=hydrothermal vent metagenome TaxID=652676 RepID=A0A3B0TTF6_9ZZZZ
MKHVFALLKRFILAREAVAAVEFALILPFLMVLYLGSIEVSQLISVDQKVGAVSGSLGDLVSRTNGNLAKSTLNDYFSAVSMIMTPYASDKLKQLVTSVYVNKAGKTKVQWSVGYNGATAKTPNSTYPLPKEMTDIARDAYVIVSEAETPYRPLGGYFFKSSFQLYKQYFFISRFGEAINLVTP